jgi:hypothetical protein
MSARDKHLATPIQWSVIATQTNATATATKAKIAAMRHYIIGFSFSSSGALAAAVTLTVQDSTNAVVLDEFRIPINTPMPLVVNYGTHPLEGGTNADVQITVGALGAGIVGEVVLKGYTDSGR